ncbi:hypothetical protein [uncultured Erythrobacter sp.]|uniref:hypothetical protein n=1 Tax=uncultured Erythrobacter sp. TaxID=263913 RepID=UPI00260C1108|nr:hypothetical protein [uncultured Erythrobacter sp.]
MGRSSKESKLAKRGGAMAAPVKITAIAVSLAMLGACATVPEAPPAPPPPPPPPPPAEVIPYRPLPPGGASYVMEIPGKNLFGKRQTVNRGLSADERVWHFRSAWNVAALNCVTAQYEPVLTAYSAYISDHAGALGAVNDRIDAEYRREAGARRAGILARQSHMTSVYNFFALPPARSRFCRAALEISNRYSLAPVDPIEFAKDNFDLIEEPFELFFEEYEQYQRASAEWDEKYGEQYGASQPGWVAVQEARANGIAVPSVGDAPASTLAAPTTPAGAVTDPATGLAVPVVPVAEGFVSQPVTQPVSQDDGGAQTDSPQ